MFTMVRAVLVSIGLALASGAVPADGHLVIIGGGDRPAAVMERIVALAGGPDARIVIIPNASSEPLERATEQRREFEEAGSRNVTFVLFDRAGADDDGTVAALDGASGVFFSGGDQSRLTAALLGTRMLERIREIYHQGGVISGTSAGAAVMSGLMITGNALDEDPEFDGIRSGKVELTPGFGFFEAVIVDQHFLARHRHNRLISAVLEHPQRIGIGIDEDTAIHVRPGGTFEVLGGGTVFVVDARAATDIRTDRNGNLAARDIRLHLLSAGERFNPACSQAQE